MLTAFVALLASCFLLHPGHSTRVEVQWNAESRSIELAMRIDHADLESALRKRLGRPVSVEELTPDQAQQWIGDYLRETLRLDDAKLLPEQFSWVGWEPKRVSSWVYAELSAMDSGSDSVVLRILTLFEVEPELNHVVTVRQDERQESVVLSKQKPVVVLAKRAAGK